jgi:prevent-host-death family protein
MTANIWTIAEAQAKFGEVIDRARSHGPQTIVCDGRKAAVVVSAEGQKRKTKRIGNLADFFAASPLRGSGVKIERLKDRSREVNRRTLSDVELPED